MRKALVLAVAGVFLSSGAMACGWGSKSASSDAAENQTVMTDDAQGGQTTAPKTTKSETKG